MNYEEFFQNSGMEFEGIETPFFLIGLLSEFNNRYQAKADSFFEEISWKQFFAIICISLMEQSPTLAQLSDTMGSSHQNVKQILNKLEERGFVQMVADATDKRKQRILLTEKTMKFCEAHDEGSTQIMGQIFEGISPEQIITTIQTILQMDANLKKL